MQLESILSRHNYYWFKKFIISSTIFIICNAMEKIIILHNSYSKTHTKIQISVNRGIEKSKLEWLIVGGNIWVFLQVIL